MPPYLQRGKVPRKRHTAFRREEGGIYFEELIGNQGFRGPSTLIYRLHRPTEVSKIDLVRELKWEVTTDPTLRPFHFRLGRLPAKGDPILDRVPVVVNHDIAMTFSRPERTATAFYRNGQGDELVYVDCTNQGLVVSKGGTQDWQTIDGPFAMGPYHDWAVYNPVHHVVVSVPEIVVVRYLMSYELARPLVPSSPGAVH
jgi:homogentisate 1,2-dioxygenase